MSEIRIGSVIKRLLQEKRRTLKEISRETGIPYSTLHTWQENRQPKDILRAQRLADYLGVSLHQLLFDREDFNEKKVSNPIDSPLDQFFKGNFEVIIRKIR